MTVVPQIMILLLIRTPETGRHDATTQDSSVHALPASATEKCQSTDSTRWVPVSGHTESRSEFGIVCSFSGYKYCFE